MYINVHVLVSFQGNSKKFKGFVSKNWQLYLHEMSQNKTWADHAAVEATASALNVKIHIVTSSPDGERMDQLETIINENGAKGTLLLGHYHEHHYQSLMLTSEIEGVFTAVFLCNDNDCSLHSV